MSFWPSNKKRTDLSRQIYLTRFYADLICIFCNVRFLLSVNKSVGASKNDWLPIVWRQFPVYGQWWWPKYANETVIKCINKLPWLVLWLYSFISYDVLCCHEGFSIKSKFVRIVGNIFSSKEFWSLYKIKVIIFSHFLAK